MSSILKEKAYTKPLDEEYYSDMCMELDNIIRCETVKEACDWLAEVINEDKSAALNTAFWLKDNYEKYKENGEYLTAEIFAEICNVYTQDVFLYGYTEGYLDLYLKEQTRFEYEDEIELN